MIKNTKLIYFYLIFGFLTAQTKIAVLPFTFANISNPDGKIIQDRFLFELVNTEKYVVLERERIDDILIELGFQQTGCVTDECAIKVGNLLGVEKVIIGTIGRIESTYTISIRMIELESGEIISFVSDECDCDFMSFYKSNIRKNIYLLIGARTYPLLIDEFDYEFFKKYKMISERINVLKGRDMSSKEFEILKNYLLYDNNSILTIIDTTIWQKTSQK